MLRAQGIETLRIEGSGSKSVEVQDWKVFCRSCELVDIC